MLPGHSIRLDLVNANGRPISAWPRAPTRLDLGRLCRIHLVAGHIGLQEGRSVSEKRSDQNAERL